MCVCLCGCACVEDFEGERCDVRIWEANAFAVCWRRVGDDDICMVESWSGIRFLELRMVGCDVAILGREKMLCHMGNVI